MKTLSDHSLREDYIIFCNVIQGLFASSHLHRAEGVYIIRNLLRYIINSAGIVYHQAAGRCTLARDEIQGRLAALDDMHRTLCGDDMPSLRLG